MSSAVEVHPSSFRDPSGFVFRKNGILYRQVNLAFKEQFETFISSGFYDSLASRKYIVTHEELKENFSGSSDWFTTLRPQAIPFIVYPYEWSFQMLKDAALLTLRLAREGMQQGFMLRDASPFNIQFVDGKPILIDSLSFGKYDATQPWIAYRQFCENFLAPLLIAHHLKQPTHPLLLAWPEGIPLSVASAMLPRSTRFSLHTYLHIHLHARTRNERKETSRKPFSAGKLANILSSLELLVRKCRPPGQQTAWKDYYDEVAERDDYLAKKKEIISGWLSSLQFQSALDLGTNTGFFAELVASKGIHCIAADSDPFSIDELYGRKVPHLTPLIIDLANPSAGTGFSNRERQSFIDRCRGTDLVMGLALVHHLAIARNIPFRLVAQMFSEITGKYLLVEFVPKEDEKARLLLSHREDVFPDYDRPHFENCFSKHFTILSANEAGTSGRTLYLMEKK